MLLQYASPAMMRKAFAVSERPEANLASVLKKCARPSVLRNNMPKMRLAVVLSDKTFSIDCRLRSLYSFARCIASLFNSICRIYNDHVEMHMISNFTPLFRICSGENGNPVLKGMAGQAKHVLK